MAGSSSRQALLHDRRERPQWVPSPSAPAGSLTGIRRGCRCIHSSIKRAAWPLAFLSLLAALVLTTRLLESALQPAEFATGWLLLGIVLVLFSFGIFKRGWLSVVVNPAIALRIHVFLGLLGAVVFLLHGGTAFPSGLLEQILAASYGLTFLSGIVGLGLTRLVPAWAAMRGNAATLDQIPRQVARLRDECEELIGEITDAERADALIDLYQEHLVPFLAAPRHLAGHLLHMGQPRGMLVAGVRRCGESVSRKHAATMKRIQEIIETKDDLDFQYAWQGLLRVWLFVHVPLASGLLVFAAFHILLVHAYAWPW